MIRKRQLHTPTRGPGCFSARGDDRAEHGEYRPDKAQPTVREAKPDVATEDKAPRGP